MSNPRQNSNAPIKQRIVKNKMAFGDSEKLADKISKSEKPRIKHARTLSDIAANDVYHYVGHSWPGSLTLYPHNRDMNMCDKFYPNADGGPLWVDEERGRGLETRDFKLKAKVMAEQGNRYIVITLGMTEQELAEVMA